MVLMEQDLTERYTNALQSVSEIAETYYFQGRLDEALRLWQTGEPLLAGREVAPAQRVRFLLRYGQFLTQYYFLDCL